MNHSYTHTVQYSEAHLLVEISDFVKSLRTHQISFDQFLQQLITYLTLFNSIHQPKHTYSACLKLFASVKYEVEQYLGHNHYTQMYDVEPEVIVQCYQLLLGGESLCEDERVQVIDQHMANLHGVQLYLRGLLHQHSRLLALRLDLRYQTQYLHRVNITTFHSDIQLLLSSLGKQTNSFTDLAGYVWSLGQADQHGGYHIRLLLLFSGNKHGCIWYMAQKIGQLWHDMTQGEGYAFTQTEIERLKYLEEQGRSESGIIYSNNLRLCEKVFDWGGELVQQEHPLQVKLSSTMHTFGWGHMDIVKYKGIDDRIYNNDLSGWAD